MRWDEYPPALRAIRIVGAIPFYLAVLGLGIGYALLGNTTGRIIGIAFTIAWLALIAAIFRWRFAKPSSYY